MKQTRIMGALLVVTIATTIYESAFAQNSPVASPVPIPKDKIGYASRLLPYREAKGLDFANLSKPENNKNLKWQRVVVGQERIDGMALVGLPKDSPWRSLGFENGDLILTIDKKPLRSDSDLNEALSNLQKEEKSNVEFRIMRDNSHTTIFYKLKW